MKISGPVTNSLYIYECRPMIYVRIYALNYIYFKNYDD